MKLITWVLLLGNSVQIVHSFLTAKEHAIISCATKSSAATSRLYAGEVSRRNFVTNTMVGTGSTLMVTKSALAAPTATYNMTSSVTAPRTGKIGGLANKIRKVSNVMVRLTTIDVGCVCVSSVPYLTSLSPTRTSIDRTNCSETSCRNGGTW